MSQDLQLGGKAKRTHDGYLREVRKLAAYSNTLLDEINDVAPEVWTQNWVVDVEPVGDGRAALKYLAPYVHRVAISDNRIMAVTDTHVSYRFTPTGNKQSVTRTVPGNEFIRAFLQHALPPNFHKIRYYGYASPNCKWKFAWVQMLVWFYLGWCYLLAKKAVAEPPEKQPVRCDECGGQMRLVAITDGCGRLLYSHPLPYLYSGCPPFATIHF